MTQRNMKVLALCLSQWQMGLDTRVAGSCSLAKKFAVLKGRREDITVFTKLQR
jgi:hypothetical protein